jgi:hypothetical protein
VLYKRTLYRRNMQPKSSYQEVLRSAVSARHSIQLHGPFCISDPQTIILKGNSLYSSPPPSLTSTAQRSLSQSFSLRTTGSASALLQCGRRQGRGVVSHKHNLHNFTFHTKSDEYVRAVIRHIILSISTKDIILALLGFGL